MKGKTVITAIAVGLIAFGYVLSSELYSKLEALLTAMMISSIVILVASIIYEVKIVVRSRQKRRQIKLTNFAEKRIKEEYDKERQEFFDAYFKQSTITMK